MHQMKDLSLFLLKNSLAAKMKRGIRSFCHGVGSTSTLKQRKSDDPDVSCVAAPSVAGSNVEEGDIAGSPLTLEQMLLQLDLEEAAARRVKLDDYGGGELPRRMSCVNNSDILRSARDALNQYPRFSLDGRDAMYRSSFRRFGGFEGGRRSVCCSGARERNLGLPSTVGGERVVWCKPGVVATLMGLDAVPVPVGSRHGKQRLNTNPVASIRKENMRRVWRHNVERKRLVVGFCEEREARREALGSTRDCCMMNPICLAPGKCREDWRFRQARR